MPIAAVPAYLQKNASGQDDPEFYLAAPPGHRFLLYFASLGENQEINQLSWNMEYYLGTYAGLKQYAQKYFG